MQADHNLNGLYMRILILFIKNLLFSFSAFHFMRDHPAHSIEVLGSGWGVRMSQLERTFIDAGFMTAVKDPIFWAPRSAYGPDQGFLKR